MPSAAQERPRLDQQRGVTVPLVIKIAPDNGEEELAAMAEAFVRHGIDGVCVGNTTLERPGVAHLRHGDEQGGLSGAPLKPIADRALAHATKEQHDFMLCDFKKDEVRRNFGEVLRIG